MAFICKKKKEAPSRVLKDKEITNKKIKYLEEQFRGLKMNQRGDPYWGRKETKG